MVILYLKIFRLSIINRKKIRFCVNLHIKEVIFVYAAQLTIDRIQSLIKEKGFTQKHVLSECGINENTLKRMTDNKGISSFYLAKIADYLNCSVDYLLGRNDDPNSHRRQLANAVNGNYNAVDNSSVTVNTPVLDEHQKLLIELYNKLSPIEQIELIARLNKSNI